MRPFPLAATLVLLLTSWASAGRLPNVVLIITDDQGHGDLGFHGNPHIRTPTLDRLARESVRLDSFYVSPVCAPTRASLMTGRWNYRTGVTDTFLGRAMMHTDEVTLAEILLSHGYRTGIFGKWHLGDNYPMRPQDQGFQEVLVHRGGGIGQPADPPGNAYQDPVLQHNGVQIKTTGYCSDIFTSAAIEFMAANRALPFFAYLSFNCPHTPLQVRDEDHEQYRNLDLRHSAFPAFGHPLLGDGQPDMTARVYGMITNIDSNVARLLAKLAELKLEEDTIVVFLTDNGPQQPRYNSGMKDRKGSVYEGGIRVPCLVRWPGRLTAGRSIDRIAAHVDLTPTLLDACQAPKPAKVQFDGRSLLPLLTGQAAAWPDRLLCLQWHRGDEPILYQAFAARTQGHKLVQAGSVTRKDWEFELYDMAVDPLETNNIARDKPKIVAELKQGYETWFKDVGSTRGYAAPRIQLGNSRENPSTLTPQDWRGPQAGWGPNSLGHWEVDVARRGNYEVELQFAPSTADEMARFSLGAVTQAKQVPRGASRCVFAGLQLAQGPGRLKTSLSHDGTSRGVASVTVRRLDD